MSRSSQTQPDGPLACRNRAFTLVELLVVIAIIGMLMALLLNAVLSAREGARRTQCMKNQGEIATAIAGYEQAQQKLPGYCNPNLAIPTLAGDLQTDWVAWVNAGNSAARRRPGLTWAVTLLPYLGRDDLWAIWRTCYVDANPPPGTTTAVSYSTARTNAPPNLAQFLCPSDTDKPTLIQVAPLSYVVNSGLPDCRETGDCPTSVATIANGANGWRNGPVYGLFMDPYCHSQTASVTTANILDGAANTMMLSENLQATSAVPLADPAGAAHPEQWDVTMVWWPTQALPASGVPVNAIRINGDKAAQLDALADQTLRIWYARPSSNHPGGVVVTYADGHTAFMNEDIHYGPPATADDLPVYQRLMCPNDNQAVSAGLFGPSE